MKSLREIQSAVKEWCQYTSNGEYYLAHRMVELIEHFMLPRQMVLYYPPGESMWNGQVTPNSVIAKLFLEASRDGADMALPEGWELKPVDEVVGVTTKEMRDHLPPFDPCHICGGGGGDLQRVMDRRVCTACWNAGKRL